jgi:hypothetical protein
MMNTFTIYVRHVPWHARLWRWIIRKPGDGSPERPFAKFKHATRALPSVVEANTRYTIDITGIGQS